MFPPKLGVCEVQNCRVTSSKTTTKGVGATISQESLSQESDLCLSKNITEMNWSIIIQAKIMIK